jgi:hypothetical protein
MRRSGRNKVCQVLEGEKIFIRIAAAPRAVLTDERGADTGVTVTQGTGY